MVMCFAELLCFKTLARPQPKGSFFVVVVVTLLSTEPEVQYVALRNINLIVQKRYGDFVEGFWVQHLVPVAARFVARLQNQAASFSAYAYA